MKSRMKEMSVMIPHLKKMFLRGKALFVNNCTKQQYVAIKFKFVIQECFTTVDCMFQSRLIIQVLNCSVR